MLVPPINYTPYLLIASIDPGSQYLGIAETYIDMHTLEILSISTILLEPDKLATDDMEIQFHGKRFTKLTNIENYLYTYFISINPSVVVCESPFFNRFRPMAYGSLTELMSSIHRAVFNYNPLVPFHTYPPGTVKKYIGAKKHRGKDPVKKSIINNPEISKCLLDIDNYSEHELDAIAVMYTYLTLLRESKGIMELVNSPNL